MVFFLEIIIYYQWLKELMKEMQKKPVKVFIEKACDLEDLVKDKRTDWRANPSKATQKTKKIQEKTY